MQESVRGAGAQDWLTSVQVRRLLAVSTCDLAHLRDKGAIRAEKRGNSYYYSAKDVESLRGKQPKKGAWFCGLDDQEQ